MLSINGSDRAAIVLSDSPLFTGGSTSDKSEIRRWLLKDDLIEAIVALPTDLLFRTNIATDLWTSIRNEGNNRRIVSDEQRRQILDIYAAGETDALSQMLDYRTFDYRHYQVHDPRA
ncbi:TPA: N-6 DNA methylase [Escherichia coli]|nr:N-6 DNA methylase [Escherichia coli]